MKEHEMVMMAGAEKLEDLKKRQDLIRELERLHREQRGWQRMVNDEELNYEVIDKTPTDELERLVELLKGE